MCALDRQKLKLYKLHAEKGREGKEYEVQQAEEDFGGNVFNTVRKARVTLGTDERYGRDLVLRRPRLGFGEEAVKDLSDEDIKTRLALIVPIVKTYQELKAAKITHIPTTYQLGGIDERDPVIVMTDYTEGGKKVALSNNTVGNGIQISSIDNLDEVLAGIEADIRAATKADLSIAADAYFFIVPAEGGRVEKMEFAIADIDSCVRVRSGSERQSKLLEGNANLAYGALLNVLINHMDDNDERIRVSEKLAAWVGRLRTESAETESKINV